MENAYAKQSRTAALTVIGFIGVCIVINIFSSVMPFIENYIDGVKSDKTFKLISSTSNEFFDNELKSFAKKEKMNLQIDYYGDLEIVDILNSGSNDYDGVWISNSIWLYMLDNSYLVTDSKSIAINPVVMAVKKSKASELGFVDNDDIKNIDILNAIGEKKLNYVMSSVTKTNTGATAYLGFLNSLAGSPEVLNSEMLQDQHLVESMKTLFTGVERVSGDELYLKSMFLNGEYDAIINYESSLIELNNELVSSGREPLYLIYPKDGVAINDMPFGYIERKQNKKENFEKLLDFLRSQDTAIKLQNHGLRTWYGGTNNDVKDVFKSDWGIDTNDYLIPLKYPSKKVMNEAFDVYIEHFRKPSHTIFCLDVSGSMANGGLTELKDAMYYILDKEQAGKDRLQFSPNDKISIITFNSSVSKKSNVYTGADTKPLMNFVNLLHATGGTDIYKPLAHALTDLQYTDSSEYTKTIILMTDGESNSGSINDLTKYYDNNLGVPVYSIMFGESSQVQLNGIAALTNGKVFDGKAGLKEAFKEVRSYS